MGNDLAGVSHWDDRDVAVQKRPPSRLNVGIADLTNLIGRFIEPGQSVLEVGCAPGKFLLWFAVRKGAKVTGVDYSEPGSVATRSLFADMAIDADIRQEDFLVTTLPVESFDVVYSLGVIEHFDNPAEMVRRHVERVRRGGFAIIVVPHYGGIYGRIQRWLNPELLAIHNVDIMSPQALLRLVPADISGRVKAYPYGRLNPWILGPGKRFPKSLARLLSVAMNMIGLMQPFRIEAVCSWLVLEIQRK